MATMTSLRKAIKHYKAIVLKSRLANGHSLASHYALGALEVLERVKALRESYREEMRRLWHNRSNITEANMYYQLREVVNCLDNLMLEAAHESAGKQERDAIS